MFGGIVVFFFIRKQKASMFKQAFATRIAREKELYLSCETFYEKLRGEFRLILFFRHIKN